MLPVMKMDHKCLLAGPSSWQGADKSRAVPRYSSSLPLNSGVGLGTSAKSHQGTPGKMLLVLPETKCAQHLGRAPWVWSRPS